MRILFEDECIVVCIKPDGILSQSDSKGSKNAVDLLKNICNSEIYPIHRLDKTTMGVMVFAKTQKSAAVLSQMVKTRELVKKYIALVSADYIGDSGNMTDLLFFDRKKNKSFVVKRERKGVKRAELDYNLLSINNGISMFEVTLKTGRTHQIRVQFASRKMALLGDKKYGASDSFSRIALCAYYLEFKHPQTQNTMSFSILEEDEYKDWLNSFNVT